MYRDSYDDPELEQNVRGSGAPWVRRGGAMYSPAIRCRSAQRNKIERGENDRFTGLRLVLERDAKP